jgi:hypothetical protein
MRGLPYVVRVPYRSTGFDFHQRCDKKLASTYRKYRYYYYARSTCTGSSSLLTVPLRLSTIKPKVSREKNLSTVRARSIQ